jgi:biopolymer transport protein ExbB/TolQ
MMDNYAIDQKAMRNYSIFVSIVCFPLGLLSLIEYFRIYGNNIKVETTKVIKTELNEEQRLHEDADFIPDEKQEEIKEETEEEKLEKLEKLRNFKEKGIITEEEFEMARQQMFGDKKLIIIFVR